MKRWIEQIRDELWYALEEYQEEKADDGLWGMITIDYLARVPAECDLTQIYEVAIVEKMFLYSK